MLLFVRGTLFDKIKESKKAESDYQSAIEIDPNYFDANYNLGALYFNNGVDLLNSISNEATDEQYAEIKQKADKEFNKSLPYLLKAHKIDNNDLNTCNSLLQVYARQNNEEKYNEMKEEINRIKNGY